MLLGNHPRGFDKRCQYVFLFLPHPKDVLLGFYLKNILVIAVRPIISTSTGSIFTKFAGMLELGCR